MATAGEITRLLIKWGEGDAAAANALFPLVYQQLKVVAHARLRLGRGDGTLSTTALVHEAYLKLVDAPGISARERSHFYALASQAMRHILVDYARRRAAKKRGHSAERVPIDPDRLAVRERAGEVVALDEGLERLMAISPRLAQIVELRFFGGLSVEETAEVLDSSPRTVNRDWEKARAFLYLELRRA